MQNKLSTIKDFEMLNKLGEGAFGVVFKVKRKQDGLEYAMKKVKLVSMKEKQRQNAVNQIRILASMSSENIIGYKDAFYDQTTSTLCVVMEFASEGDILKKISNHTKAKTKFKQQQIWKALVHMTRGLNYLHGLKILHRDLKCANVFINKQGAYKLGDLNVSKVLKKQMAHTQTGTPYYASPEVWQDQPYDAKSDIWSLGCVVYQMAALKPPFQATDLQGLFRKVKAGIYQRIPSCYSGDLVAVINMLLKVNPKLRPSAQQILQNSIVKKHFNDGEVEKEQVNQLLQTIKFNPNNLKVLKDRLPKSNYEKQEKEEEKPIIATERKPEQKKTQPLKKSIEKPLLKIETKQQSRGEFEKKNRQRVMSAGGIRPSYNVESPKIITYKKDEPIKKEEAYKKMIELNNPKLPPRPQNQQQPGQYKLPPKPQQNQIQNSQTPKVLQTPQTPQTPQHIGYYNENQRQSSQQRRGSMNNVSYDDVKGKSRQKALNLPQNLYREYLNSKGSEREKSKENLRNIGANIVGSNNNNSANRLPRSNSVQRIQPSWWG